MINEKKLSYQESAKIKNQNKILRELWFADALSRSEISRLCGIGRSTATYLISSLLEQGIITSSGLRRDSVGHPMELLEINAHYGYIIGARLTLRDIRVCISDFRLNILWQDCIELSCCDCLESLSELISGLIRDNLCRLSITPDMIIGFGYSGTNDSEIKISPYHRSLLSYSLADSLSEKLGIKAIRDSNPVNSARVEKWADRGNLTKTIACIEVNRFIGCGYIVNGELYEGGRLFNGLMLSHINIVPGGRLCVCGNRGCWGVEGSLDVLGPETIEHAMELIRSGDEYYREKLENMARSLAKGISIVIRVLGPDSIVISGPVTKARDLISGTLRQSLAGYLPGTEQAPVSIRFSPCDISAPLLGALLSVIETVTERKI